MLDALPLAGVLERRPVFRLAPGRDPVVAAERVVVSRRALADALGAAAAADDDLLRHAGDRIAERFCGRALHNGDAEPLPGGLPARVPVLLPLPLRPITAPAPRPGLVGVLPLAAAATASGALLAERRAELAALGWRLGIGGLDAAALRFVALAALGADLLLFRWSPALARQGADALRGADPHALVLTGCDGADAVEWGRNAGLTLFSGPGLQAEAAGAAPC
ncbi:hypothetical protein GCM10009416_10110 [Craurococcus roseus]|uniref:Uncharacterized protein n=1 Tax=Craurococcus roseus TaxID=77585 RepID=A0ABN1ETT5_9PROT